MNTSRGFTLIELLITVAIVAILSGVLILSSGLISRDHTPDNEARRVLRLLHLFRGQAVSGGQDLGLYLDDQQLLFMARTPEGWSTGFEAAGRVHYDISDTLHSSLEIDGININADENIEYPHIVFLSDGQISPFVLRFSAADTSPAAVNEQLELIQL